MPGHKVEPVDGSDRRLPIMTLNLYGNIVHITGIHGNHTHSFHIHHRSLLPRSKVYVQWCLHSKMAWLSTETACNFPFCLSRSIPACQAWLPVLWYGPLSCKINAKCKEYMPQRQVSRAGTMWLHPTVPVGCNYLPLPLIPAPGTTLLIW